MSSTFESIRGISVMYNENNGSTEELSSNDKSSDLSHTMSLSFHNDDNAAAEILTGDEKSDSTIKFDDSFHLSESIQPTKRATFHKYSKEGAKTAKENPYSKKAVKEVLSTCFRMHCDKPVKHIVEAISIALSDEYGESYGLAKESPDGKKGINIKEVRDLTYYCTNLSFNPKTCTWLGKACYECDLISKSPKNPKEKIRNSYSGNFLFSVSLQTVEIDTRPKNITQDQEENGTSVDDQKHYCVDLEAILGGDDDDDVRAIYDRHVLKILSHTITNIGYDVSRVLYWLGLPEFPEGCQGVKFRTLYQLNAKIKSGSFATVCLGTHRATQKKIAVKCVQRKNLPPTDDVLIHSEVGILSKLQHEYICPLIDFFMEEECYYIVMDLMEGGDVFDRVGKIDHYDESIARDLCKRMLQSIAYCHEKNIVHADLKTKNLLLRTTDNDDSVMLADFGFAMPVFAPKSLTKQCGTPYFVAPEILLRKGYDQQADMWSVGVIMYCLLSGSLPFTGKRHLDLFKSIIAGDFEFHEKDWEGVSDDAKDLINKLLITNPDKRYTATDALRSKWIRANDRMLKLNSLRSASTRLRTFNARLKFKSTVLVCQSLSRWKNLTKQSIKENEKS